LLLETGAIKEGETHVQVPNQKPTTEDKINESLKNKSKHSLYKHEKIDTGKATVLTLITMLFIADWGKALNRR
jgi:hypothetical protein